jgi:hypothetical protein
MQDLPRPGSPETKHDLAVAGLGACQPAQQQVDFLVAGGIGAFGTVPFAAHAKLS